MAALQMREEALKNYWTASQAGDDERLWGLQEPSACADTDFQPALYGRALRLSTDNIASERYSS
jgi:hypothetical protein